MHVFFEHFDGTCYRAAGTETHVITPDEVKKICPLLKVDDLEVNKKKKKEDIINM